MMLEQKKVSKEEKVIAVQYMVDFMHLSSYQAKESNDKWSDEIKTKCQEFEKRGSN